MRKGKEEEGRGDLGLGTIEDAVAELRQGLDRVLELRVLVISGLNGVQKRMREERSPGAPVGWPWGWVRTGGGGRGRRALRGGKGGWKAAGSSEKVRALFEISWSAAERGEL